MRVFQELLVLLRGGSGVGVALCNGHALHGFEDFALGRCESLVFRLVQVVVQRARCRLLRFGRQGCIERWLRHSMGFFRRHHGRTVGKLAFELVHLEARVPGIAVLIAEFDQVLGLLELGQVFLGFGEAELALGFPHHHGFKLARRQRRCLLGCLAQYVLVIRYSLGFNLLRRAFVVG